MVFLGSNIGNFEPEAARDLLARVRRVLRPGDELLIGVDLVKPERDLLLAYDDPLGVTAAFNRNLLVRINRELDGDIDLAGFRHAAVWNAGESRVEMHLVSTRRQRVRIPRAACDLTIDEGETIWTESSYKFDDAGAGAAAGRQRLHPSGAVGGRRRALRADARPRVTGGPGSRVSGAAVHPAGAISVNARHRLRSRAGRLIARRCRRWAGTE